MQKVSEKRLKEYKSMRADISGNLVMNSELIKVDLVGF